VGDVDADVERGGELALREPRKLAPARVVLEEAGAGRSDDRDQVGNDRRGRLHPTGPWPLERDLPDRVALEHHRVEGALDGGERVVPVDKGGPDADVDLP